MQKRDRGFAKKNQEYTSHKHTRLKKAKVEWSTENHEGNRSKRTIKLGKSREVKCQKPNTIGSQIRKKTVRKKLDTWLLDAHSKKQHIEQIRRTSQRNELQRCKLSQETGNGTAITNRRHIEAGTTKQNIGRKKKKKKSSIRSKQILKSSQEKGGTKCHAKNRPKRGLIDGWIILRGAYRRVDDDPAPILASMSDRFAGRMIEDQVCGSHNEMPTDGTPKPVRSYEYPPTLAEGQHPWRGRGGWCVRRAKDLYAGGGPHSSACG